MANKQEDDDEEAAWQDWDVESEEGSSDDESDGWINVGSEGEDDIDISDSEEENDKKKKKKGLNKKKKSEEEENDESEEEKDDEDEDARDEKEVEGNLQQNDDESAGDAIQRLSSIATTRVRIKILNKLKI